MSTLRRSAHQTGLSLIALGTLLGACGPEPLDDRIPVPDAASTVDAGWRDAAMADVGVGVDAAIGPDEVGGTSAPLAVGLPYQARVVINDEDDDDCFRISLPGPGILSASTSDLVGGDCLGRGVSLDIYRDDGRSLLIPMFMANLDYSGLGLGCPAFDFIRPAGTHLICVSEPFSMEPYPGVVDLQIDFTAGTPSGACPAGLLAETDAEVALGGACTSLASSFFVHFPPDAAYQLTTLAPLAGLTSIGMDLSITGADGLVSLGGLESLTTVGGEVKLGFNDALTDLSALSTLSQVGNSVHLWSNPSLTNLSGLGGITSAYFLWATGNAQLLDLGGLSGLTTVTSLKVDDNSSLAQVNLPALASVTWKLEINANPVLHSLDLPLLTAVDGDFTVQDNTALPQCQVDALVQQVQAGAGISGTVTSSGNNGVAPCP